MYNGKNSCYVNTFLWEQESGQEKSLLDLITHYLRHKRITMDIDINILFFHNLIKYGIFLKPDLF